MYVHNKLQNKKKHNEVNSTEEFQEKTKKHRKEQKNTAS